MPIGDTSMDAEYLLLYYKVKIYVKVSTYTPTKNIIK